MSDTVAANIATEHSIETVAIVSPGDRTDKLTDPLAETGVNVTVNPESFTDADAIICDTPDRQMFKVVCSKPLHATPVIFRLRGDPWWGIEEWIDSQPKRMLSTRMLRWCDGCLALGEHQAAKFRRRASTPTRIIRLPKRVAAWPDTEHRDHDLQIVTLTNGVYREKIDPLIDIMPAVHLALDDDERWRIGSWSDSRHVDRLREAAGGYEAIEVGVGLDAHDELRRANLMIHFSELDVRCNAILEGMASGIPVLTNAHPAFVGPEVPTHVVEEDDYLCDALETYRDPRLRESVGADGMEYVAREHAPGQIGAELVDAITAFVEVAR